MTYLVIIKSRMMFSEVCTCQNCKTVYFTYKLLITGKVYLYKALKTGSSGGGNPCPTLYGK